MRLVIRLVVILLVVGIGSYMRYNRSNRSGATYSAGGVPMAYAKDSDPRLVAAKAEARRRWPEFVAAYQNPGTRRGFSVKHAFPTKDGSFEHMWVNLTSMNGGQIQGTLDDQPFGNIGLKENDPVTLTPDEVEDWLFIDSGKRTGGFSAPVLEQMEAERKRK